MRELSHTFNRWIDSLPEPKRVYVVMAIIAAMVIVPISLSRLGAIFGLAMAAFLIWVRRVGK